MSNELNALLGKGSDFQGKLTFEGSVRIDGRFTGEIFSDGTLIIGEGAQVQAEIRVGAVAVYGNVTGNIIANESVELHAPASLRGNISSPALHIDKGVFFDGACQMTSGKDETRTTPPSLPQRPSAPRQTNVPAVGLNPSAPNQTPPPAQRPVHQSGMFVPEPTRTTGELTHKF
jgi:cytoskeletal protein CcmA (bactofilin family)